MCSNCFVLFVLTLLHSQLLLCVSRNGRTEDLSMAAERLTIIFILLPQCKEKAPSQNNTNPAANTYSPVWTCLLKKCRDGARHTSLRREFYNCGTTLRRSSSLFSPAWFWPGMVWPGSCWRKRFFRYPNPRGLKVITRTLNWTWKKTGINGAPVKQEQYNLPNCYWQTFFNILHQPKFLHHLQSHTFHVGSIQ